VISLREKTQGLRGGNGCSSNRGAAKLFLTHSKRGMISQELIRSILESYALPWGGTHGVPHWARVLENGRRLSEVTGARSHVVNLFAVFHDSQRINEGYDDGHGRRGAELARELRGMVYELGDEDFNLLIEACNLAHGRLPGR